jgi:hypothetical protein
MSLSRDHCIVIRIYFYFVSLNINAIRYLVAIYPTMLLNFRIHSVECWHDLLLMN